MKKLRHCHPMYYTIMNIRTDGRTNNGRKYLVGRARGRDQYM